MTNRRFSSWLDKWASLSTWRRVKFVIDVLLSIALLVALPITNFDSHFYTAYWMPVAMAWLGVTAALERRRGSAVFSVVWLLGWLYLLARDKGWI